MSTRRTTLNRARLGVALLAGVLSGSSPVAASTCTAADLAGTYRSRANVLSCEVSAADELVCRYGPDNSNFLTLKVSDDGRSAKGSWQRPSGLGGPAEFDVDSACSLANGRWGMAGGKADRPWDTTGTVTRIDDSGSESVGGRASGGLVLPGGRGKGTLTDEQLEKLRSVKGPHEQDWEAARREAGPAEGEKTGGSRTGRPVPVGPPSYAGRSGSKGENRRVVDLETDFLRHISWGEVADKPCWIRLSNTADGSSSTVPAERIEGEVAKCGKGFPSVFKGADPVMVEVEYPLAIEAIRVCQTRNRNNRIKGISVSASPIHEDGTKSSDNPDELGDDSPNCRKWEQVVYCGGDKAATGLVVHYDRGSRVAAPFEFVGLELICRKIGLG